jgi:hypothetical protein
VPRICHYELQPPHQTKKRLLHEQAIGCRGPADYDPKPFVGPFPLLSGYEEQLIGDLAARDFPRREGIEIAHAASLAWAQRLASKPSTRGKVTYADHRNGLSAPRSTKWFQPGRAATVLSVAWCRRNPMSQRGEPAPFASSWRARQATGRCNTGWCGRS